MKLFKGLIAAAGLALVLSPFGAQSASAMPYQFYVKGYGGAAFPGDLHWDGDDYPTQDGYTVGGAVGTQVAPNVDVEIDTSYTRARYEGYNAFVTGLSTMANVIYNVPTGHNVTPYVGVGIGVTRTNYIDGGDVDGQWKLGYQGIAGVKTDIAPQWSGFVEYRYQGIEGDVESNGNGDIEFKSHNVLAGVRFTFGATR